jgi:hypothetical protein
VKHFDVDETLAVGVLQQLALENRDGFEMLVKIGRKMLAATRIACGE